jgi:hypothetical protein
VASSTNDGVTPLFTALVLVCLRIRAKSIGESCLSSLQLAYGLTYVRFRDIGYQHIPFFNCPNSPKCSGCVTGRLTDGEPFLHHEDCRPNWFKYVGMD